MFMGDHSPIAMVRTARRTSAHVFTVNPVRLGPIGYTTLNRPHRLLACVACLSALVGRTDAAVIESTGVFEPAGISADGSVVVGGYYPSAFRWTQAGGATNLGYLSSNHDSYAYGVSGDGTTAVGVSYVNASNYAAFRWTQSGGMVSLGQLSGGSDSTAKGAAYDGSVVVGFGVNGTNHDEAFRWTQSGGMVGIGALAGKTQSSASDVSADGSVVVGYSTSGVHNVVGGDYQAFRWTQSGGMTGLGFLSGGTVSSATAVSADGTVIVGFGDSSGGYQSFRWTETGGMVGLGNLPNASGNAVAVSGDGSVIVGDYDAYDPDTDTDYNGVFIWDQLHGMRDLRQVLVNDYGMGAALAGWSLDEVAGISDDGLSITGFDFNTQQGWVVHLDAAAVPEPSSFALVGAVVGGAWWKRRRRCGIGA